MNKSTILGGIESNERESKTDSYRWYNCNSNIEMPKEKGIFYFIFFFFQRKHVSHNVSLQAYWILVCVTSSFLFHFFCSPSFFLDVSGFIPLQLCFFWALLFFGLPEFFSPAFHVIILQKIVFMSMIHVSKKNEKISWNQFNKNTIQNFLCFS